MMSKIKNSQKSRRQWTQCRFEHRKRRYNRTVPHSMCRPIRGSFVFVYSFQGLTPLAISCRPSGTLTNAKSHCEHVPVRSSREMSGALGSLP